MSGLADLSGHHILVVEDDYYLASDTARSLKEAGAHVLGPCSTEEAARDKIRDAPLSAAVLDINLRGERSFALAYELKARAIPFLFLSGYDQEVIPADFDGVALLQKPGEPRKIISALARMLGSDG
ncbi:MAG TPA: hypothetical protein VF489_10510 [Sphingobium sp.]